MTSNTLAFPIGQFEAPTEITPTLVASCIADISNFPKHLRQEVQHLTDDQLDTAYRPEGWTIRQVVNHCADSHINSIIRFKLALTEENPIIKPYNEAAWAELSDSKNYPIDAALKMLEGTHTRWAFLLEKLTGEELKRTFVHPQHNKEFCIDEAIALYAWHCKHHLAHITTLKKTKGWK